MTPMSGSVMRRRGVVPAGCGRQGGGRHDAALPVVVRTRYRVDAYLRVTTSMRPENTTDTAPMRCSCIQRDARGGSEEFP